VVQWENGEVRVSLERPLSLKYVDLPLFQSRLDGKAAALAEGERIRVNFLEGL
jgi:hypothetical protein